MVRSIQFGVSEEYPKFIKGNFRVNNIVPREIYTCRTVLHH